MASIRSLVVKIGAQTEEIDSALKKLGASVKSTAAELKAMDQTPLGQAAVRHWNEMNVAIGQIRASQEKVAEGGRLAAVGIEKLGGASRLTKTELDSVNRTLQTSIDAYRALGQQAPKQLQDVADAVARQRIELSKLTESGASGFFNDLGKNVLGTAAGFISAQAVIGGLQAGFRTLSAFVQDSVKSFADAERGQAKLTTALKAQGTFTPVLVDRYNDLSSAFEKTTVFSDDLITSSEALLIQIGNVMPSKMQDALQAATNLASGLGVDLETATTLVAKASAGHTETLSKYGITVDKAALKTQGFDAVLQAINRQFGGQAAAATETYAGRVEQAANAFDNLKERVGEFVVSNSLAVASVRTLTGLMQQLAEASKTSSTPIADLTEKLGIFQGDQPFIRFLEIYVDALNNAAAARERIAKTPNPFKPEGLPVLPPLAQAALEADAKAADERARLAKEQKDAAEAAAKALDAVNKKIAEALAPTTTLTDKQKVLVSQYKELGLTNKDIAIKFGVSERSVETFSDELDDTSERMAANRAESARMAADIGKLAVGFRTAEKTVIGFKGVMQATDPTLLQASSTTDKFNKHLLSLKDIGGSASGVVDKIREAIDKDIESFEKASFHLDDFVSSLARMAQISGGSFGGLIRDIAQVVAALEMASKAAKQINLIDPRTGKRSAGNIAGGLLGGAIAVGSATGSGSLGSRIGGGALSGAATGSAFGPIGAAVGGAIGGAVGFFRGLFGRGDEKKKVDEIRQALIDARGGWDAFNRSAHDAGTTLERVLNARTVKDYESALNDLDKAIQFQNDAMATLEETTQKYGFTIDELGPAFQRQQLDKQAQTLFQDFSVLTSAGIDLNTVIARMAPSINEFAQAAIRTGQEIPAAMRPMLEKMVEMGLLTDENGKKLENLDGVKFSETMTEGFSRVVESVEKLTDAIARGLGLAIDTVDKKIKNIPPVDVDVRFNVPDSFNFNPGDIRVDGGATGGLVTANGIQRFGGGRVLPFFRRGTDTVPAMLTPGEIILNAAQQGAVAAAVTGGAADSASRRVESILERMEARAARNDLEMPKIIARYVRDAVQTARVRR